MQYALSPHTQYICGATRTPRVTFVLRIELTSNLSMYACNGHLVSYSICSCRGYEYDDDANRKPAIYMQGVRERDRPCIFLCVCRIYTSLSQTGSTMHVWCCLRLTYMCARIALHCWLLRFHPRSTTEKNLAPQTVGTETDHQRCRDRHE